jgi:hypothetical protein
LLPERHHSPDRHRLGPEIGPYSITPSTISETGMNDYMKAAYPAAIAAE